MHVEAVLEEAHERAEKRAHHDANHNNQRLGKNGGQVAVADEHRSRERGGHHLAGDADVEEAGTEAHHKAQRCQQHGGKVAQEGEEVRLDARAAAVAALGCQARALEEAVEPHERVLAKHHKEYA